MVVQAAVTPSRSRRLLFKLPVATLRRNSEER
ncbi:FERM domain-containing protein 4A isoform X3, partial [Tachysurus ichikawai]